MPSAAIQSLLRDYRLKTGFQAIATDQFGRCTSISPKPACKQQEQWRLAVLNEALRWGEPCIMIDPEDLAAWGVPLMVNSRFTGGIVVEKVSLEEGSLSERSRVIRSACSCLLEMVESANLTNAEYLCNRRDESQREREKAEAIHLLKTKIYDSIRDLYLREEPGLLAAIKRGERAEARAIINRVVAGIHQTAYSRPELFKSLALELVVVMARAAVESGADPSEVLGCNFESATALASLAGQAEVSSWLTAMLERIMDAIRDNRQFPNAVLLGRAIAYMEEHMGEALDRDAVARAAGLSGSHFSHLIREKTGRTFTDLMAQARVDRAKILLRRSGQSIIEIALECGFEDQSYFTRVFKRYTGTTPRAYRGGSARQDK